VGTAPSRSAVPLTEEDLKDMREELISVLMRGKQLTREKATEIIEAVF
jgi:hypothetical protein